MAKPKEMRELLAEYIKEHNVPIGSSSFAKHPGEAIFEMMIERQESEGRLNNGGCNPFADVCISAVQLFIQKRE